MPDSPSILDRIIAHKHKEVRIRSSQTPIATLESRLAAASATRGFARRMIEQAATRTSAVICEIKRASPSKGLLRSKFNPRQYAAQFELAGASCLSVLTDKNFFQGSDQDMIDARSNCTLPVIRKDFIVEPYQVLESRALGADCVLLIVAAITEQQLHGLHGLAKDIGLDVLVEVHNEKELERALRLDARMIGINNRNLHTFETTLNTTLSMIGTIPRDKLIITESGILKVDDVKTMHDAGIFGFLVGEALMRQPHPGIALTKLFEDLSI